MGLELRHLRYFVAVADHGQMSAAANSLLVAQPAVSQAILQLERDVGVTLFRRHPGGVELTAAGQALLPKARVALASAEEAFQTARALAREQSRTLVVGFLAPLTSVAAKIMTAYQRAHPILDLQVKELEYGHHIEAVRARAVDIAFVWSGADTDEIVVVVIVEEPRVVCLAADHPLAGHTQLRFEQVEDEAVPATPAGFSTELADFIHLGERRRRPARQADFAPRTIDETVWMLLSRRAICLGPASLAEAFKRPGLVTIPLSDVEPVQIALARRRDDHRPALRAFVRTAHEHFRSASDNLDRVDFGSRPASGAG